MVEVAAQPNMTIVLPVPVELLAGGSSAQAVQAAANAASALAAGAAGAKQLSAAPTEATDALKTLLAEPKPDAKIPR